ncbi:MAG: hypothetical protein N3A69_06960, partial [Leptospiraceae bacterium]|nr:hypothetical protein [Leptospiraceae bacterium]
YSDYLEFSNKLNPMAIRVMSKDLDKFIDRFFFTHPMNLERVQKLKKKLAELQAKYDSFRFWINFENFANKKVLFLFLLLVGMWLVYYFNFRKK